MIPRISLAQTSDFIVISTKVDNVRNAKSIFTTAEECGKNSACLAILKLASNYFGIPIDKAVASAALLAVKQDGEGTYIDIKLPSGYSYCKATINTVSIVPKDGPRGSTLLARADNNQLYIETWTPILPVGQGRSWVEADIAILGVRNDIAEREYGTFGDCEKPSSRVILYCRGGGCESPKTTEDNGQSVNAAVRPTANSRN